jgi:hypothetical protein
VKADSASSHTDMNVSDIFLSNFDSEEVDLRCEKCNCLGATLQHEFQVLPRCIILHIKRFKMDFETNKYIKLTEPIDMSLKLDLSGICSTDTKCFGDAPMPSLPISIAVKEMQSFLQMRQNHISPQTSHLHTSSNDISEGKG